MRKICDKNPRKFYAAGPVSMETNYKVDLSKPIGGCIHSSSYVVHC